MGKIKTIFCLSDFREDHWPQYLLHLSTLVKVECKIQNKRRIVIQNLEVCWMRSYTTGDNFHIFWNNPKIAPFSVKTVGKESQNCELNMAFCPSNCSLPVCCNQVPEDIKRERVSYRSCETVAEKRMAWGVILMVQDVLGRISYSCIVHSFTDLNINYASFFLKFYQHIGLNSKAVGG